MKRAKEPPRSPFGPKGTDWAAVCAEVDTLNGDWGRVGVYHASTVSKIKAGQYPAVDPDLYEVTSRREPTGQTAIWMRRRQKGER